MTRNSAILDADMDTREQAPKAEETQNFVREAYLNLMDVHGTNWLTKDTKTGEVSDLGPVWIAFCTNGAVKADGDAVMGVGLARLLKEEYPNLPSKLGSLLNTQNGGRNTVIRFKARSLFTFPHQDHWRNPPTLQRIFASMKALLASVNEMPEITAERPIYVERPGYQPDPTKSLPWLKVAAELARAGADDRFVFVAPLAAKNGGAAVVDADL